MNNVTLALRGYYTKKIITTALAFLGFAGGLGFLYMKINPGSNNKLGTIIESVKPYIGLSKKQPMEAQDEIVVSLDELQKEVGFAPNSKFDPFLNPLERADDSLNLLLFGLNDVGSASGIILSGIFIGPESRVVLVNGEVRKEGESINGVKIAKIEDGAVVFETQDGETFRRVINQIRGIRLLPSGYKDTRTADNVENTYLNDVQTEILFNREESGEDGAAATEEEREYEIESQ